METVTLDPTTITVAKGLDRFRRDLGKLKDLAQSIATFGQLQPIVINREQELICGGRRLAACILSKQKVVCAYIDNVDPITMREMELEENIQRKEFSPAEECLAIEEIHKLKTQIHGRAVSGRAGGWRLDDTAEAIGKTRGNVIEAIQLAEMVKLFPELKKAKTKSEIKKAAKGLERIATATAALVGMEERARGEVRWKVSNLDARDFLCVQPDGRYDVFLTDPPYGIDVCNNKNTVGGYTGGQDATGIYFNDSKEVFLRILEYLPKELFRITKHNAQGFMFFAPEFYQPSIEAFRAAGWSPYIRPLIWTKGYYGHSNQPGMYPTSAYEMCLFVRKTDARLVKEGMPDYISCLPVVKEKIHPTEKPIDLLLNLLERVSLPGMSLIDPFAGSGSSLHAGMKMKLFVEGNDILPECYALIHDRLEDFNDC